MNDREYEFLLQHQRHCECNLQYEPAVFRFSHNGTNTSYRPDFYCSKSLTFYEVVGSRQAFEQNQARIASFKQTYPQLKFEIVKPNGHEYLSKYLGARRAREFCNERQDRLDFEYRKQTRKRFLEFVLQNRGMQYRLQQQQKIYASQVARWKNGCLPNSKTCNKLNQYIDSMTAQTVSDKPGNDLDCFGNSGGGRELAPSL